MKKFLLAFFLLTCMSGMYIQAQRPPIDAVLVLDVSNSMRQSDPNRLAQEAMALFIYMLGTTGDRVGVVAYAGEVVDTHPMKAIYGEEEQRALLAFINGLGHAGWTDHTLGLDKAMDFLAGGESSQRRVPIIVLLTDGNTELAPRSLRTYADTQEDLTRILAQATYGEIPIYTIGLNHNGRLNHAYIENIAETTGARAFITESAENLPYIVGDILGAFLTYVAVIKEEVYPEPDAIPPVPADYAAPDFVEPYSPALYSPAPAPQRPRLLLYALLAGGMIFIALIIFLVIRKPGRVFTGGLILETANHQPRHCNLIPYGKHTTLRALIGGSPHLAKIALSPSPTAPSHRPQLLLKCKHPHITFRKDFHEYNAKKGLKLSPGTEVVIQLPENVPAIRVKYVA
ncbi:MAG: VWA domain-containing protein [Defluviitaleaceae bacterium]|nr:VWA domain-containing protein [Defluviitaleaceae bacterium]MCL2240249.1 VWA domain-containing protein [Defluviitaleaceae bacterium]